jgi:hypothetical protein
MRKCGSKAIANAGNGINKDPTTPYPQQALPSSEIEM